MPRTTRRLSAGLSSADLAGQPRGRLDAGERDGRDDEAEDQLLPGRRAAEVDRVGDRVDVPDLHRAHRHDHEGEREVEQPEAKHEAVAVRRDAADVRHGHVRERRARDHVLDHPLVGHVPEGRQVVRDRERPDREHDQVVEQDGPAGHEAPQLVEGVARERRGAAALGMEGVPLQVGHHRDDEEDRREQERDRRQAERVTGHHAEDEVDRGARRAQRDGEDGGGAEAAVAVSRWVRAAAAARPRGTPSPRRGRRRARRAPRPARVARRRARPSWRSSRCRARR